MAGPRGEECAKCYFWVAFGETDPDYEDLVQIGTCHLNPPLIPYEESDDYRNKRTSPMSGIWEGPNTRETYWCGSFKPRPEP